MFDIERWQEIFETIGKNKLRTFLTGLSVASGIFILVILLGFSSGIQKGVKLQFAQDAESRISVWTNVTTKEYKGLNPGRRIQLHNSDYETINTKFEDEIEHKTALYNIWGGRVNYKNEFGNYRIEGANPGQQFIENASLTSGRFLNQNDIDEGVKVAIIGNKVKQELFKTEEAVGKTIKITGINFIVAGVFTDPGGEREEQRIFIPISTAQRVFNAGDKLRSVAYTVKMSDNFDEAVALSAAVSDGIEKEIKSRYSIAPDDRSAVRVFYNLEEAQQIYGLIDTMRLVFWVIGIFTIVAGVVGVSNIMLIIVKERTKEIGVRKALGALPSSIVGMILQESVFITAIAGFTGLFAGVALLEAVSPLIDSDFIKSPQVNFTTAVSTVLILILSGAVAGYIPARRAANIKPIEALRDE
ncbi:ABC transporter permease [Dokdonia pacifica]|uniref:Putative ABC transport system permease protein n=1 Tax=Dokdonia pacifica TaxID=1627892 RepID=A0A238VQM5_9FLAO|nr:ABC transporter permease [Dokdonia pacifica]GGG18699.1 ABC transporter permease [Dokdonia pacifica]SNR36660.1 putative ABC transport system permease protein [Dokdonia pacifica]